MIVQNRQLDNSVRQDKSTTNYQNSHNCAPKTVISNTRSTIANHVNEQRFSDHVRATEKKPIELFCDWITVISPSEAGVSGEQLKDIIELYCEGHYFNKQFDTNIFETNARPFKGAKPFNYSIKNTCGAKLDIRENGNNYYDVSLKLSGHYFAENFKNNDLISIAKFVQSFEFFSGKLTRIDLSIDDAEKTLDPYALKGECELGNYKGFKKFAFIESGKRKIEGQTLSCGSRESTFFARIYDTWQNHKKIAVRYEAEIKREFAVQVQNLFKSSLADNTTNKELSRIISKLITSKIIFCEVNKKDKPLIRQWENFLSKLDRSDDDINFIQRDKRPSLEKVNNWMTRQVGGTLDLISQGLGIKKAIKYFSVKIKQSQDKKRPKCIDDERELLIKQLKREGITALLTQDELDYAKTNYGIDFGIIATDTNYLSMNFKPNKTNILEFNKPSDLFEILTKYHYVLDHLREIMPSLLDNLLGRLKPNERMKIIKEYLPHATPLNILYGY